MEAKTTPGGRTVYVARDEGERGSKGPFFVVYGTSERRNRYGWFCSHCETFDNAMDAMGRIECNTCGNMRKPTDWDDAHE